MRRGIRTFGAVLLLILLGVVVGMGLQGQAQVSYGQPAVPVVTSGPVSQSAASVSSLTQLMRNLYTQANPSVVSIRVRIPAQGRVVMPDNGLTPGGSTPYQMASGSGFVYDNQGHIVTNAHVVQGADQVEVTFSDGNILPAKTKGIDLDSDLAVIQVQGDISRYAPLTLGNSDNVQVGDVVVAIGNPFEQAGSMTHGIISALNRTVQGLRTTNSGGYSIPGAIQTDAPLNPGNSGGPLLNENAQVIGVNEQIEAPAGQSSGVSFAIPVNLVKLFVPSLIENGKVEHSYLGISSVSLDLDTNQVLKLPEGTRGALVTSVTNGSPAARAGLHPAQLPSGRNTQVSGGDVITAVDGQAVRSSDDLIGYLFTKTKVGQSVTLTVLREGKQQSVQVKLAARPGQ